MNDIDKKIASIGQIENRVREHINTHRYQSVLIEGSNVWSQICSSLDVVGDTLCAIGSYESSPFPEDVGLKYIATYGILQALFIQQDALRHLSEAFDIDYKLDSNLKEIRENRNAAIGHPTKQKRRGENYYNHVSRVSLSKTGFDLLRFCASRPFESLKVDLKLAINLQLDCIAEGYERISSKLSEIDKEHREKFMGNPLQDIFHSAMGYCFEKVASGIYARSYGDKDFGHDNLKIIKDTYRKFESALRERNELSSYTAFDLREYFHALDRLDKYFSGEPDGMEEADARIYHSYLRNKHEYFVRIAEEIDGDYQEKT